MYSVHILNLIILQVNNILNLIILQVNNILNLIILQVNNILVAVFAGLLCDFGVSLVLLQSSSRL